MKRLLSIAVLMMGVLAAPDACAEGPRVVKMTVSPSRRSATPIPNPLLPHMRDIKPGNAAVFYQRSQALEWWTSSQRKAAERDIETLEKPWQPKQLSLSATWGPVLELDQAARCETCDWQLLERYRAAGIVMMVPDQQAMRTLGAVNAVRVREAIHKGDFDKAAHGLQTSFAMAKHVGEAPLLISYLIGAALSGVAQNNLEDWVQQADAPNLYWALTDLPQPLIDWRRTFQADAAAVDQAIPEIRRALQASKPLPIPAETLQLYVERFWQFFGERELGAVSAFLFALAEPEAKAFFQAKGLGAEDIERLPVTQLGLMFFLAHYDLRTSEWLSVQNLPYWQARPFLKKWGEQFAAARDGPLLERLKLRWVPAYDSLFASRPRTERRLAMLRHVEALRLYAGQHQGQWPDSLDDIRDLPLPVDPFTGKAFTYRREGKTAIVEAPPPPGMAPVEMNWVRYELTLRDGPFLFLAPPSRK